MNIIYQQTIDFNGNLLNINCMHEIRPIFSTFFILYFVKLWTQVQYTKIKKTFHSNGNIFGPFNHFVLK